MRKTALTIAGSDCSGGAGIQADIKTMMANGVYAMSVITAMTAQNTTGVYAVQESTPEFLEAQLDCVFRDIFPDAVKIGMVYSAELIDVIAERLLFYGAKNIVLDPVMVSTAGSALLKEDALDMMKKRLIPLATILTPNIPEAEMLTGRTIAAPNDMESAAEEIYDAYLCAVLIKGGHLAGDGHPAGNSHPAGEGRQAGDGHLAGDACDLLYRAGETTWFCGDRIDTPNTHGTGCTLSSAIAANLAKGMDLSGAVGEAKAYLTGALRAGLDLGRGSGPVDHGFS